MPVPLGYDSFDLYATADITKKWSATGLAGSSPSVTIGATGANSTQGLTISSGNGGWAWVSKAISNNTNDCIVGFRFKWTTNDQTTDFFSIADGATAHVMFALSNSGQLFAYRGHLATLLGTASGSLSSGAFNFLEFRVKVDDSAGTVDVYVNGSNVLSLTTQDTRNGGSAAQWNTMYLGNIQQNLGSKVYVYDDFYYGDSSSSGAVLGPCRSKVTLPNGAGNSSQFTPSAGSNWQNVDEANQDGDTTYNGSTTAGHIDLYTGASLGVTSGTVKAVQTCLVVRSNGAGAERIKPMFRIGGTNYEGTEVGVTTSYLYSTEVFHTSPATSNPWSFSEIDGAERGMKLVS